MGRNQPVINRQNKKDTEMTKNIKNESATSVTDLITQQCEYIKHIKKNQQQKPEQLVFQDLLYPKRKGDKNDI